MPILKTVTDAPAQERWRTAETVDVSLHLPASSWALLRRAMQAARQVSEQSLTDAEALEAVANQALASLCQPADASAAADPRRAVVLYRCRECGQTELETGAGPVALPPAPAKRLSDGAKVVDLQTEGIEEATADGTMPAAVRRAVLARDRGSCRLCGRRKYIDIHHLRPRSHGGEHSRQNCVVLCSACHGAVHHGQVQIQGSAEGDLQWRNAEGQPLHQRNAPIGARLPKPIDPGPTPAADPPIGASSRVTPPDPSLSEQPELSEDAQQVLRTMGDRSGWHGDQLIGATGLTFRSVSCALLKLALAGAVREGPLGYYSPIRA